LKSPLRLEFKHGIQTDGPLMGAGALIEGRGIAQGCVIAKFRSEARGTVASGHTWPRQPARMPSTLQVERETQELAKESQTAPIMVVMAAIAAAKPGKWFGGTTVKKKSIAILTLCSRPMLA
jgi:hypothetical protein